MKIMELSDTIKDTANALQEIGNIDLCGEILAMQNISADTWLLFVGSIVGGFATLLAVFFTIRNSIKQQSKLIQTNINIELFEKRYSVYSTLSDIRGFANGLELKVLYIDKAFSDEICKKFNIFNNELLKATILDRALFNDLNVSIILSMLKAKFVCLSSFFVLNLAVFDDRIIYDLTADNSFMPIGIRERNDYEFTQSKEKATVIKDSYSEWQKLVKEFNEYISNSKILEEIENRIILSNKS